MPSKGREIRTTGFHPNCRRQQLITHQPIQQDLNEIQDSKESFSVSFLLCDPGQAVDLAKMLF